MWKQLNEDQSAQPKLYFFKPNPLSRLFKFKEAYNNLPTSKSCMFISKNIRFLIITAYGYAFIQIVLH